MLSKPVPLWGVILITIIITLLSKVVEYTPSEAEAGISTQDTLISSVIIAKKILISDAIFDKDLDELETGLVLTSNNISMFDQGKRRFEIEYNTSSCILSLVSPRKGISSNPNIDLYPYFKVEADSEGVHSISGTLSSNLYIDVSNTEEGEGYFISYSNSSSYPLTMGSTLKGDEYNNYIKLNDENGRNRVTIGSIELLDKSDFSTISRSVSSLTLFDPEGKVLHKLP
ncbi:hypothetical protein K8I28_11400 [bacterium]|nr:hypothetical protein [bacterium]